MNRARPFKPLWQSSIGDRAMRLSDTGSASSHRTCGITKEITALSRIRDAVSSRRSECTTKVKASDFKSKHNGAIILGHYGRRSIWDCSTFSTVCRMDLEDSARPAPAVVACRLSQWPFLD